MNNKGKLSKIIKDELYEVVNQHAIVFDLSKIPPEELKGNIMTCRLLME